MTTTNPTEKLATLPLEHTPGPWNVASEPTTQIVIGCNEFSEKVKLPRAICFIPNGSIDDKEPERYSVRMANARLIASAPELLTQCQMALAFMEGEGHDELHGDLAECLRDVIKKATQQ